jgi:hypothetical protein
MNEPAWLLPSFAVFDDEIVKIVFSLRPRILIATASSEVVNSTAIGLAYGFGQIPIAAIRLPPSIRGARQGILQSPFPPFSFLVPEGSTLKLSQYWLWGGDMDIPCTSTLLASFGNILDLFF